MNETTATEIPSGTFESPGYGGIGTTRTNCVKITEFYDEGVNMMLVRVNDSLQPENTFGKYKVIEKKKYRTSTRLASPCSFAGLGG